MKETQSTVGKIFEARELENRVCAKFAHAADDGFE